MSATKLENLLNSPENKGLDKIIQRAQKMDELTSALRKRLPVDLADNLLAANLREGGELALVCTSSAWASRLRFESEELLAAAGDAGFSATSVRVSVSQNR